MLVLSRRVHEKVYLFFPDGTRVEVVLAEMQNGKVRLGFTAPKWVNILRAELADPPAAEPAKKEA